MNETHFGDATLYLGDCLDVLRTLPDASVDSVVTDPPYGLSFMGKRWDYDVPSVEIWAECLRVLKPGGHLLAFAGTRTQHRMAVRIEDAGFEIRDMLAWLYGSGFPKSHDVSKAIDAAAGAEREIVDTVKKTPSASSGCNEGWQRPWAEGKTTMDITAPATEAAKQWDGWGTALKPALETVTFASKPYTAEQERHTIQSNLIRLEARLWLLLSASAAEKNSTSNPSEYGAACAIAQWGAGEITSTHADLCGQMGTSLFALATTTSLNIVSSWRRILDESWSDGSTSTIETKSSTTIDWRTLKFSVSQITPASIIRACSLPGGFSANASTAESHFNASLLLLQSILTLSVTEPVISLAQHEHQGAGVTPNLDPVVLARKPLAGTVAANVLAYDTGGLNIAASRIKFASDDDKAAAAAQRLCQDQNANRRAYGDFNNGEASLAPYLANMDAGRWPANVLHDGSDQVLAHFPDCDSGTVSDAPRGRRNGGFANIGADSGSNTPNGPQYGDTGSAARFFYCAKASKADRDEGLHGFAKSLPASALARTSQLRGEESTCISATKNQRANVHPTVKPTDLMRYLLRLVTPPGGTALDPFMGSGSTGKAALLEHFKFIGIERDPDYLEIAKARIDYIRRSGVQVGLFGEAA